MEHWCLSNDLQQIFFHQRKGHVISPTSESCCKPQVDLPLISGLVTDWLVKQGQRDRQTVGELARPSSKAVCPAYMRDPDVSRRGIQG